MDDMIQGAIQEAWGIYVLMNRCSDSDPRKRDLERFVQEQSQAKVSTSKELIVAALARLMKEDRQRRADLATQPIVPQGRLRLRPTS